MNNKDSNAVPKIDKEVQTGEIFVFKCLVRHNLEVCARLLTVRCALVTQLNRKVSETSYQFIETDV